MMYRSSFLAVFSIIAMALLTGSMVSCGTRTDGKAKDVDTTQYALAQEEGPGHDEARTLPTKEVDFAGKHYTFDITIAPCDSLPMVKDSYDDPYLDNEVKVKVTADGASVFEKRFIKKDFIQAAGSIDTSKLILGGIAFNTMDNRGMCFGAQLNEPGDVEGGYVFKITVQQNGSFNIVRDTNVEDLGNNYVE